MGSQVEPEAGYLSRLSGEALGSLAIYSRLRGATSAGSLLILSGEPFAPDDIKKAQAFATSADLREARQGAGVIDKPDICFLT